MKKGMVEMKFQKSTTMALLLIASAPAPSFSAPPAEGKWEPIPELTDEFKGDRLDASKWHDHNPAWKGRKPGFFSRGNTTLGGGRLHLAAKAEELPDLPKGYHSFTTAAVKSKAKVLYGYFEIKCKPMNSRASSAFWFYARDPSKKKTTWWTEIDVFEICGRSNQKDRTYHMNAHVFATPEDGKKHWNKGRNWEAPFRFADEFHVYALEWDKNEIKWYVDGTVVHQLKNTHWHQPLHMNFDSETFPKWFGLPKKENLPSTFSIEYVRSWGRANPADQAPGSK